MLDFIRERVGGAGFPPTLREIAGHFGFSSTGTVRDHLKALARKGYLELTRQKARAIGISGGMSGIPIAGRVVAGEPRLAEQDIEGYLDLRELARPRGDLFALRVDGDSMKDAGIMAGDTVVVRRQARAEDGDIVVALVNDEATVKFLRRKGGGFSLHPANSAYRPIPLGASARILGRVVTVMRNYV